MLDQIIQSNAAYRGREHFFMKVDKFMKERVCRALKAQRKQQMAYEFHKIASLMHTIVLADVAWRRKVHETLAKGGF